jgi:3D (Asp-Asp-Asp) domain-containing protein
MSDLILIVTFLGIFTTTSYRSVKHQTDDSPYITSIGHRTSPLGCAVSQDLLADGTLKYGDLIYIQEVGFRTVNDTMNPRMVQQVDIWVATHKQEKEFDAKFKGKKLKIWIIKTKI